MPWLQAATNNIFGFVPDMGPQGRVTLYPVSSSEATAVLQNDVIVWTTIATARVAVTADTPATARLIGVASAGLSTASFDKTVFNLACYEDPQQVYVSAISTAAGLTVTDYGKSFNVITTSTGTGVPSTMLGISKMHLAPLTASSGAYFRMLSLHPVEIHGASGFVVTTSAGKPQKYLVMPNNDVSYVPLTT